jgi:HlyD family secretion protein
MWITALMAAVGLLAALSLRPKALEVELATVLRAPLRVTVNEDGFTRLRKHVELSAPVNGRLGESMVEAGDSVTLGQVVARLAPAPLDERAREQAEATLQATRATRSEAEARLDQANIALDEARRRHARTERMAQAGVISAQEMETATAELRIRERDLDAARSRVRAAVQEERAARTALVGSDPSKPISQAPVVLRSPIAGRVLRVFEEHDRVIPAGTRSRSAIPRAFM